MHIRPTDSITNTKYKGTDVNSFARTDEGRSIRPNTSAGTQCTLKARRAVQNKIITAPNLPIEVKNDGKRFASDFGWPWNSLICIANSKMYTAYGHERSLGNMYWMKIAGILFQSMLLSRR